MTRNAYSIDEVAERNDLSRSTIYREHGRGRLRFIRIGARTLITAEEEARWLREAETVGCGESCTESSTMSASGERSQTPSQQRRCLTDVLSTEAKKEPAMPGEPLCSAFKDNCDD